MGYDRGLEQRLTGRAPYPDEALNIKAHHHFNAIEHSHNVMGAAQSLSGRVLGLVSKLLGPQLEEAGVDGRPTHGPGILPSLHDVSDETGRAISKANEALDRLEKELA